MAFFKSSSEPASDKFIGRLHAVTWALIYGGLLTLVLGLSVQRTHDPLGWSMVGFGALVAAAGFLLMYFRSRIKSGP